MVYGYVRVSRREQNEQRQIRNILSVHPDAQLFVEKFTGTKVEGRVQLERLLKIVKEGDVITFDSVSRMSRNAADGVKLYQQLFAAGVELEFIKEPYCNTQTYKQAMANTIPMQGTDFDCVIKGLNEYMLRLAQRQIELAFAQAEKEVNDLHQRTREGIETARRAGKQIGGMEGKKLTTKKSIAAKAIIREHSRAFGGSLKDDECAKLAGIAMNTYYKYKREIVSEMQTA